MEDDFDHFIIENNVGAELPAAFKTRHQAYLLRMALEDGVGRQRHRTTVTARPTATRSRTSPRASAKLGAGLTAAAVLAIFAVTAMFADLQDVPSGSSAGPAPLTESTYASSAVPSASPTTSENTAPPPAPSGTAESRSRVVLPTTGGTKITSASQALARAGTSENDPAHPGSKAILSTVAELRSKIPELSNGNEHPTLDPTRPVWAILVNRNYKTFGAPIKVPVYDWGVEFMDAQTGIVFETMAGHNEPPSIFAAAG